MGSNRGILWVIFSGVTCLVAIVVAAVMIATSAPAPIPAGRPAALESVRVSLSPYLGTVVSASGAASEKPMQPALYFEVLVENTSATKKIDFEGWDHPPCRIGIVDDLGNNYGSSDWTFIMRMSSRSGRSIYPGTVETYYIMPEDPVALAKSMTITLAGEAIGEKVPIVFDVSLVDLPHKDIVVGPPAGE